MNHEKERVSKHINVIDIVMYLYSFKSSATTSPNFGLFIFQRLGFKKIMIKFLKKGKKSETEHKTQK